MARPLLNNCIALNVSVVLWEYFSSETVGSWDSFFFFFFLQKLRNGHLTVARLEDHKGFFSDEVMIIGDDSTLRGALSEEQ